MRKIIAIAMVLGIQTLQAQQKEVQVKEVEFPRVDLRDVKIMDEDFNVAVPTEKPIQVDENAIYNSAAVEQLPNFPGGIQAFYKYMAANFALPEDQPNLKGKMIVGFVVEKDGSLSGIKVYRDLGFGTGKEVIRVLKKSPKWMPGMHNGKSVRVQYSLPINFPYKAPDLNKNIQPILDKK